MKKIFMMSIFLIFFIFLMGCQNSGVLNINSFDSKKTMPYTIFSIQMNREYTINDEYSIQVKYGHTISDISSDDEIEMSRNVALLKIQNMDYRDSLSFEELMKGKTMLEIEKFLTNEYFVARDDILGIYRKYKFNKTENLIIPKEIIENTSGILCFSFICLVKNDDGSYYPHNYVGSSIYVKYEVKDDQIFFKSLK